MNHLPSFIQDLAVILMTASIVTLVCKKIKQPLVLGYLVAGFLVGPHVPFLPGVTDVENIRMWGELGVIVLLFTLGLEFSFRRLSRTGGAAFVTGLVEILFMLGIGYLTGRALGWTEMDSLFLGGILSISSTTIILKSFEELGQKGRSYVPLVLGVLIVEDLIAVLLMVLLSTVAISKSFSGVELLSSTARLGFFLVLWTVLGTLLLPAFIRRIKKNLADETVLIVGFGLCLMMVVIATAAGFSPALGAFVMGSLLSETSLASRLEHVMHPVKDLFGAVFFVSMGMLLDPGILVSNGGAVLLIVLVTIFGKTFSTALGALMSGQSTRRSIQAGLSLAQIGEFSFIIAALGSSLKVTGEHLPAVAVAVSAVTSFTTPLLIKKSGDWADSFEKRLPVGFVRRLENYRASLQTKSAGSLFSTLLAVYGPKLLIYSTLIIGIALAGKSWALPVLLEFFHDASIASVVCLAAVLLLAAPFFWGLIFSHPRGFEMPRLRGLEVGVGLTRALLGSTLFAFCVAQYLSAVAATGLVVLAVSTVALLFTRFAEPMYRLFESTLRLNIADQESQSPQERPKLAPWDATLTQFTVSPDSLLAGQTLISSAIKERFGVSVALIERGSKRILAPGREMLLLPSDKVFLIGNEAQIASAGLVLEGKDVKQDTETDPASNTNFGLSSLVLEDTSPFLGRTIRASGLRERISGMIVGIERDGDRILNPDSGLILQSADLLWIVGDVDRIHELRQLERKS